MVPDEGFAFSSETSELLDSAENLDVASIQQLVKNCAPILQFHPDEEYKIVNVACYLKKSMLGEGKKQIGLSVDDLKPYFSSLQKPDSFLPFGNAITKNTKTLPSKPLCYAHVKNIDQHSIDIQYWFLFSGKSGSTANIKWLVEGITGYKGKIDLNPIGCDGGHWERITVRISKETFLPYQIFLPNSKGGEWIAFNKMETDALQAIVFVSKNNHFFYNSKGLKLIEFLKYRVFSSALEFSLFDECAEGKQINFQSGIDIISSDFADSYNDLEPDWLFYPGHWGNPNPTYLNAEKIHDIIKDAFGANFSFLLGQSVLNKLSSFLIDYYSKDCKCKAQGPQQKKCWQGEELA